LQSGLVGVVEAKEKRMTDITQLKVQLRNLREWREDYYNGSPLVSDAVYDDVEDQVRVAAKTLPDDDKLRIEVEEFLAGVGAAVVDDDTVDPTSKWVKVTHKQPMGSLNKAQVQDEVEAWLKKCLAKLGVALIAGVWSDKCDGISCFDGDTPVHLANGETIPIREICEQNLRPAITTWSQDTGEVVRQVLEVHDNGERDDWIRLTMDDGSTVVVTENHLFYVPEEGWVAAKDLLGKQLLTVS